MSHKWHGSQANNKHSIIIADTIFCSPTFGLYFDTDAIKTTPKKIKDKKDRESGQYEAISIDVRGKERKMRQIYMSKSEEGTNIIANRFDIGLRKADPSDAAEMSINRQLLTAPEVIVPSSSSIIPVFDMKVELDILYKGTVVEVEPGSRDGTYSLTVWLDNGTTRRDVEYPSEDVYVIGKFGKS